MATILQTAANTPLVLLQQLPTSGRVLVKLESMNPSGSLKDRVALQLLDDLHKRADFDAETTVVTASSGNTGVSLAMACAAEQIKLIVVMPANMSIERRLLIYYYGSALVLTDPKLGLAGAVRRAESISRTRQNCVLFDQFNSDVPFRAHEAYTAAELISQCREFGVTPRYFVSGIGSGATLCACSKALKQAFPQLKAIGVKMASGAADEGFLGHGADGQAEAGHVAQYDENYRKKEPAEAELSSASRKHAYNLPANRNENDPGADSRGSSEDKTPEWEAPLAKDRTLTGICPGLISCDFDERLVDRFVSVSVEHALKMTKLLARREGIVGGISSGANVSAALRIANQEGCDVITLIPDTGERYLSLQGIYDELAIDSDSDSV